MITLKVSSGKFSYKLLKERVAEEFQFQKYRKPYVVTKLQNLSGRKISNESMY